MLCKLPVCLVRCCASVEGRGQMVEGAVLKHTLALTGERMAQPWQ